MADLLERYVHQVGRYLPPKERGEIQAELRSLIQDQLDDRYPDAPTDEQVAAVLNEFGDPRQMAASYSGERYLIGPDLYPSLMMVLGRGAVFIPAIVIFLNIFAAFTASEPEAWHIVFMETVFAAVLATFMFSGLVVLVFAMVQHSGIEQAFNPLMLPEVDDPSAVDRFESGFGVGMGVIFSLAIVYFLRVGGLTLRLNLDDPGDVLVVPQGWLFVLLLASIGLVIVHLLVLRRNRWRVSTWTIETVLEMIGAIAIYFAIYAPVYDRFLVDNPSFSNIPIPEVIAIGYAVFTLVSRGSRLVSLINHQKIGGNE